MGHETDSEFWKQIKATIGHSLMLIGWLAINIAVHHALELLHLPRVELFCANCLHAAFVICTSLLMLMAVIRDIATNLSATVRHVRISWRKAYPRKRGKS